MTIQAVALYIGIGVFAGVSSGVFGVGGGLVIIPALIYLAGYSQFAATGTSLAVLLPPSALRHPSNTTDADMSISKRHLSSPHHL